MKYIRKSISIIAILSLIFALSFANANAATIYESKTKETVTSGVTLETITRFTDDGWQKINVLRVNLDNPNVKVDTLINSESVKNLTNVKNLAQSSGAVAAINAGFFNWLKGESGKGYPDGPVIQSGEFLSVDSEYNRYSDSMATLAIDKENNVYYDFWKTDINIYAPDGSTAKVTQYNKPSSFQYNDITIWSSAWEKYSLGVSQDYPDLVEVVVVDDAVVEIRQNLPAIEIPQNGYVIISRGANAQYLLEHFKEGDPVELSFSTVLDWENIEMAVTGSAILVKDGQIPEKFSYEISGVHPRTAAGSSKSGKELLLVTVDGRQAASKGMTQRELANLMLSLGAYNAINLDGGGSTSMVSRIPATNNLKVVNTPSDGALRSISTAIGVFSVAPPSSLEGMIIESVPNVFVNTSIQLSVKGYDKYFNPISVDQSSIQWSVSGIKGSFEGNAFRPESTGVGTITASVNGIKASTTIRALEAPNKLILSDKKLYLVKGNSHSLTVKGVDNNGYSSYINPADIKWTVSSDIVSIEKNTVTALKSGTGYIEVSLGDARAYCAISVASESVHPLDNFEVQNGSFQTVPADLPGSYEISAEEKKSGNYSGKLSYDFSYLEGTRAAYLVFSNGGINLDINATEISMLVNNPSESPNWLRAEVVDASGQKHLIDFTRDMSWTGWKRVFASLQGIKSPSKLTKVYVVQVNPVPSSGSIYIDELSLTKATFPEIKDDTIPEDVVLSDKDNREVALNNDSIKISVFSGKSNPENMLQKLLNTRFYDKVKADNYTKSIQNIADIKTNTHIDVASNRLIVLNTTEKSIRTSSAGQWQWFLDKLNSHTGDNIFIFMKNSPDTFSDSLEAKLFKDILVEHKEKTGKNIWVFYNESYETCYSDNGIKYFGTTGLNISGLTPDNAENVKYIEVTVNGKEVSYQYKSPLK
ncbi:phosphodiester glycosidase family protein [Acetivibrio mesophilus]|uniref:Phosphodiester glycosidase family protein n=1 Tax=Acetivibrio mesophilus TaxID=2487273 RepID=A0A4Q0I4P6_9FIRM|nr:phosphodiester glycosidase family protein [Acetivibrio mesophilus]RXE59231.1 phosphodiester glycosidase family protein [Acetivibrio mesophilus]HHV28817.1 phosphodiester glycosidase family protein [Clostridium sp.]